MKIHFTLKSGNAKTGPIPVSTTSADTCPDACPFKSKGCYAKGGPLAIHWRKVTEGRAGYSLGEFTRTIAALPAGQLWRHNQAGDLPGEGDVIDGAQLRQIVKANRGRRGFTYTHKPLTPRNLAIIRGANKDGFTINVSANSLAHADTVPADLPTVAVVPSDTPTPRTTPGGRRVVVCPATTHPGVSCATCGLCQRAKRDYIIAFPAHGASRRAVDAISRQ